MTITSEENRVSPDASEDKQAAISAWEFQVRMTIDTVIPAGGGVSPAGGRGVCKLGTLVSCRIRS